MDFAGSSVRVAPRVYLFIFLSAIGILSAFVLLPVNDAFVSAALCSGFLISLLSKPRITELFGLTAFAAACFFLRLIARPGVIVLVPLLSSALGAAGFLILIARMLNARDTQTENRKTMCVSVGALILCALLAPKVVFTSSSWDPRTLDLYAFSFDASLGLQPSFVIGRIFQAHPAIAVVCRFVYLYLPAVIGLTQFAYSKSEEQSNGRYFVMKSVCAMAVVGWILYRVFPAAGPVYLWPMDFPREPLTISQMSRLVVEPVTLSPTFQRNAMPSLHLSWALLVCYSLHPLGGLRRWMGYAFLTITFLATLGMGEHYLVDLVVAFPFTAAMLGIVSTAALKVWRTRAVIYGALLTAAWLFLLRFELRFFWISRALPWSMMIVTIAASVYLGRQLIVARSVPSGAGLPSGEAGLGEAYSTT